MISKQDRIDKLNKRIGNVTITLENLRERHLRHREITEMCSAEIKTLNKQANDLLNELSDLKKGKP